jgi:hypothetical protein
MIARRGAAVRRLAHAGHRLDRRAHLPEIPVQLIRIGEPIGRERQPHRQQVRRVEAGVDVHQPEEAAHHEPRSDQQHERQRHFGHDEDVANAAASEAAARGSILVLHGGGEVGPGRLKRRHEAEEDSG